MRLTARGRTALSILAATLLTVAVLGWGSERSRQSPPAGEASFAGRPWARPTEPAAAGRMLGARPAARPEPVLAGSGRFVVVPGRGAADSGARLRRYSVQVELGVPESPGAFAAAVQRILADPRGWGAGGRLAFQRVASGPVDFTVVLASPVTTDRLCRPLDTAGIYSCFSRGRSVVNYLRWRDGAAAYAGRLAAYRDYVVSHEVGHALGHDHERCPGAGRLAPTMMQQTKGVGDCRPNPWPYPGAA